MISKIDVYIYIYNDLKEELLIQRMYKLKITQRVYNNKETSLHEMLD